MPRQVWIAVIGCACIAACIPEDRGVDLDVPGPKVDDDAGFSDDGGEPDDDAGDPPSDAGASDSGVFDGGSDDAGPSDAGVDLCTPENTVEVTGVVLDSNDAVTTLRDLGCVLIAGDLRAEATTLVTLELPGVVAVNGAVVVANNASLTTLALPALEHAAAVQITDNPILETVDLGALIDIACLAEPCPGGSLTVSGNDLTTLDLSSLATVGGDLEVENEQDLTSIDLSSLSSVGGSLAVSACPALVTLELGVIGEVGGSLTVADVALTELDLSTLPAVGGDLVVRNADELTTIDLSSLEEVGSGVEITGNAALDAVLLPLLASIGADFVVVDNDALAELSADALVVIGGFVTVEGNQVLVLISLIALPEGADVSVEVDPAVGIFMCRSDACIDVPAGALAVPTALTLRPLDPDISPPPGRIFAGPLLAFLPHGTSFLAPVTLFLPFGGDAGAIVVVRRDNDADTTWEIVVVLGFAGGFAQTSTSGFSIYAPVLDCDQSPPPPGCEPCGDLVDNDGDGLVDEGCTLACVDDSQCPPGHACNVAQAVCECLPRAEACDGDDDDCNGIVDDDCGAVCAANTDCPGTLCVDGACTCVAGVERCDGADNDCDGIVDDACVCDNTNPNGALCPAGFACVDGLCECVAAPESCDGRDNDCDGAVDEGCPPPPQSCGSAGATCPAGFVCDVTLGACVPNDFCMSDNDCAIGEICSGGRCVFTATEVCGNATDDDGDGFVDETCDLDQDGLSFEAGDCDDLNAGIPGAETCDGVDQDCDGAIDDGLGTLTCGVGGCARTVQSCVGGVSQVCTPGTPTTEACNGIDDDCNGLVDDFDGGTCSCSATGALCAANGDCCSGLCSNGLCASPASCGDGVVNGGEECDDGNGITSDACVFCRNAFCGDAVVRSGVEECDDGNAIDGDGCSASCTVERCGDGVIRAGVEDCDGANLGGASCTSLGFTGGTLTCSAACSFDTSACTSPDADGDTFTIADGDCDDNNSAVSPGANEICNNVDDDCNGTIDDLGQTTCGVGACQVTVENCIAGVPQTCTPGTGSAEVCNTIDDDCNGQIDDRCVGPACTVDADCPAPSRCTGQQCRG